MNKTETLKGDRVKDQYPDEQNYVKLKPSHLVTKEELRRIVYINE